MSQIQAASTLWGQAGPIESRLKSQVFFFSQCFSGQHVRTQSSGSQLQALGCLILYTWVVPERTHFWQVCQRCGYILTWQGRSHDHEGDFPKARLIHCTPGMLTHDFSKYRKVSWIICDGREYLCSTTKKEVWMLPVCRTHTEKLFSTPWLGKVVFSVLSWVLHEKQEQRSRLGSPIMMMNLTQVQGKLGALSDG